MLLCLMCPCSPNNHVHLTAVKESPVLQREGFTQNSFDQSGGAVPTMEGNVLSLSPMLAF